MEKTYSEVEADKILRLERQIARLTEINETLSKELGSVNSLVDSIVDRLKTNDHWTFVPSVTSTATNGPAAKSDGWPNEEHKQDGE